VEGIEGEDLGLATECGMWEEAQGKGVPPPKLEKPNDSPGRLCQRLPNKLGKDERGFNKQQGNQKGGLVTESEKNGHRRGLTK
jgi:hypothetical protein